MNETANRTVGVVGLGLIGGSLCKALKAAGYTVLGSDRETTVCDYAQMAGIIDERLTPKNTASCGCIFVALYPAAAVRYVAENAALFGKDSIVTDCCGVKRSVCAPCFAAAEANGFHYIGGHPMAGRQFSGLKNATATLFSKASMILVPRSGEDLHVLARLKTVLTDAGFGSVTVTTAEEHDRIIAYTSQLAHVVSNAYVKSPRAHVHKGFSAGSYRDLTRVAYLNEEMWVELFLDNRDHLAEEIGLLTENLLQYKKALEENNADALKSLLREGRLIKEREDMR